MFSKTSTPKSAFGQWDSFALFEQSNQQDEMTVSQYCLIIENKHKGISVFDLTGGTACFPLSPAFIICQF